MTLKIIEQERGQMKRHDINIEYLLQNSAGNLYWKDINGRYLGANHAYMALMLARTTSSFIGKTDREIFSSVMSDEKLKIIEQIDQDVIKTGNEKSIQEEGVDINGKQAFYITKKMPLRDETGSVIGIMGTSIDITNAVLSEQKAKKYEELSIQAEEKAASEREMKQTVMVLVGDIVHDLRTPISTIRTVALLLDDVLPSVSKIIQEAKDHALQSTQLVHSKKINPLLSNSLTKILNQALTTMNDFINTSLIELSNAQKDTQEAFSEEQLIKCSSRRILENALEVISVGNTVKMNKQISYEFSLMGNSILIMKILFNLIKNAIEQITLSNKGEIYISTKETDSHNIISIKDTAGGISHELEGNLFQDYFTTKKHGTGIGLSSSKRLMKHFNGMLTYINTPGESIEFILSFPKISEN